MKIVILSTLVEGGAGIAAQEVQRALTLTGHDVSFCSLEKNSATTPLAAPDRLWKQTSRGLSELFQHWSNLSTPEKMQAGSSELFSDSLLGFNTLSAQAAKLIAEADVISLQWMAGIWPSPTLLQALAGKKVVITLHDMAPMTGGCHYHLTCRNFEKQCGNCPCLPAPAPFDLSHQTWIFKNRVYKYLNPSIITPSRWMSNIARKSSLLGAYPVHTAIHSQNLELFKPLSENHRMELRAQHGFSKDSLIILAGAQNIENSRKNISILFDALNMLHSAGINFELVLFGHGNHIEQSYPVRSMATLNAESLRDLYVMADIFIHPSKIDALSLTLCESQCCGTPVMSFDAGGTLDTFADEISGFLVKDMTSQAMADKLIQIAKAPARLHNMRATARSFAEEHFSPQTLAERYLAVFASAVPAGKSLAQIDGLEAQTAQNVDGLLFAIKLNKKLLREKLRENALIYKLYCWKKRLAWSLKQLFT